MPALLRLLLLGVIETWPEGGDHRQKAEALWEEGQQVRKRGDMNAAIDILSRCLSIRERYLHVTTAPSSTTKQAHPLTLRTAGELLSAYLSAERWEEALALNTRLLAPGYIALYPTDPWPLAAVQQLVSAKLACHLNRLEEAQQYYRRALAMLAVTHGRTHPLYIEAEATLADLLASLPPSKA